MDNEEMKNRTREFAKRIINLCRHLPNNREGRLIGDQLFCSGTSVASNYRASCCPSNSWPYLASSLVGIVPINLYRGIEARCQSPLDVKGVGKLVREERS